MLDFDSIFTKKKDTTDSSRTHRIGAREVKEEKLLSEGAFGYIWRVIDVDTKEIFAMKKIICSSKERLDLAKNELETMRKLRESPYLVKFYGGSIEQENGNPIVVILMELCPNGNLFDLLSSRQEKSLSEAELLRIVEQVALGIKSVHDSGFTHRDIKIQNAIQGSDKIYKLCDFGSCTNKEVDFAQISSKDYATYEDQFECNTTPMYRPPQMVDPFKKFKVSRQVDLWMLGCVLYTLCYNAHPFVDASKAGISSAAFRIPKSKQSQKINDFIRTMLTPNPSSRATVDEVLDIVVNWGKYSQVPMNSEAKQMKQQYLNKEKELAVYEKKTVEYADDIPIEVLMKLQNQLKQNNQETITSFRQQNQHKTTISSSMTPPQPQPQPKSQPQPQKVQEQNPVDCAFSEFSFRIQPKQSLDAWKGNQFLEESIKKSQSQQFNFFGQKPAPKVVQSVPSVPSLATTQPPPNKLPTQSDLFEFFSSESQTKPPPKLKSSNQFDFL